ncbi:hypothetical protein BGZ63DRAFT_379411 [Mariannaea sp. PMI_226]|nr:hypothetical protein BGZ63DRAFT_379411 [Mariannaea sp. PMI_226]
MEYRLAPGTPGTWLVRGSSFCGMIIARYPRDPLALLLTAEQILTDLANSFPRDSLALG